MSPSQRIGEICPQFTPRNMPWNDVTVFRLREFVAEGLLSASQIAHELGVSRCAVLGKLHRLGLSNAPKESKPGRPIKHKAIRFARIPPTPIVIEDEDEDEMDDTTEFCGVTLMDLGADGCRYAHGDGRVVPYTFCNSPRKPGASYCVHHCRLVYVPQQHRRPSTFFDYSTTTGRR